MKSEKKRLVIEFLNSLESALKLHSSQHHAIKEIVYFKGDMIDPPHIEDVIVGLNDKFPFNENAFLHENVEKSFDRLCDFLENEDLHEDFKD